MVKAAQHETFRRWRAEHCQLERSERRWRYLCIFFARPKNRVSSTMLSRAAFTLPPSRKSRPCELLQEAAVRYEAA